MRCKSCGEELNTINGGICPNCGTINDINTDYSKDEIANNSKNVAVKSSDNKKNISKNLIRIIVSLVLVILLIISSLFSINYLKKNDIFKNKNKNENKNDIDIKINKNDNYVDVSYNGYTFSILKDIKANTSDYLELESSTWFSSIQIISGKYDIHKGNTNTLISRYTSAGYNIDEYGFKKVGNTECLLLKMSKDGQKIITTLSGLDSSNSLLIVTVNYDNSYDIESLNEVFKITSSAVKNK